MSIASRHQESSYPMTTDPKPRSATSGAETGRKLLHVLMCFTAARPTWSVAELADELDLTTSTAYRYVGLLKEEGFLEVGPDSTYGVAFRALTLSDAYAANRAGIVDVALPVMRRLRDESGETVLLARRVGDFAFCVDRVESLQQVRLQFDRGQAMALHSGSMPRLLLSMMPDRERHRYLERVLPLVTPERREHLTDQSLAEVAKAGWAQSMEEIDPNIWGCAAAINRPGEETFVIGVAGPVYRLDEAERRKTLDGVIAAATEIADILAARR
jgi:DNA-binding IclR family transcriptional regulator